jgi:hypothetical protein
MNTAIPFDKIHEQIYRTSFRSIELDATDYFFLFYLLHSYVMELSHEGMIEGMPDVKYIHPLTQRGASEILSLIWGDSHLGQSPLDEDWPNFYWEWNGHWDGEKRATNLKPLELSRVNELKSIIEQSELVEHLALEES